MHDLWWSRYACKCNATHHSLDCCKTYTTASDLEEECPCLDGETLSKACCNNNFYPDSLNVTFDEIPAEDVVSKIVSQIDPFLKSIFADPESKAFTKYNNPERVNRWNWAETGQAESAAKVSGLYHSNAPIMKYDASEVGYPFRANKILWQTCEGLLRQVSFSLLIICRH